jgi:hypothetical protein
MKPQSELKCVGLTTKPAPKTLPIPTLPLARSTNADCGDGSCGCGCGLPIS